MARGYSWRQNRKQGSIVWIALFLLVGTSFIAGATSRSWAQPSAQSEPQPSHTVQPGETLSEIAAAYGVALADLMALNGITEPDQIYVGQELTLPANAVRIGPSEIEIPTHTVAAGETLSQIARRYGLSTARLMFLNGISDADAIYTGQVLRLPVEISTPAAGVASEPQVRPAATPAVPTSVAEVATESATESATPVNLPATHEVQPGETLSEIAKQYGLTVQAMLAANGIQNADAIYSGQVLRIPGAPTATSTDTPTATPSPTASFTPADAMTPPAESTAVAETNQTAIPTDSAASEAPASLLAALNRTYTVRLNDTLPRIAQRLGVDLADLQRINRIYASRDLVVGAELIVPAAGDDLRVLQPERSYTVQPGDSLSVIAKNFGLSLAELMAANYIDNPDTIAVGQQLLIPSLAPADENPAAAPRIGPQRSGYYSYAVQPGETLSELATAFDSTMLALLDYNGLPNAETVYQGLELRIPYGPPPLPVRLPPVVTSGTSFLVSLSRQECWLFWGKVVKRRWKCSTGYGEFVTRTGNFAVQSKIENAKSNAYRLDMPYWLGIYNVGDYENGIHGLPVSWATGKKIWTSLIGQPATFGCAMLDDKDAAELFDAAYIGMPVYIID